MGVCALWLVAELSRTRRDYEYVIADADNLDTGEELNQLPQLTNETS